MLPLGEIWLRKSPILGVRRSASAQVIVWAFVDATKGFWHEFPDVGHNRFFCVNTMKYQLTPEMAQNSTLRKLAAQSVHMT